jgi:hypothetical protein
MTKDVTLKLPTGVEDVEVISESGESWMVVKFGNGFVMAIHADQPTEHGCYVHLIAPHRVSNQERGDDRACATIRFDPHRRTEVNYYPDGDVRPN